MHISIVARVEAFRNERDDEIPGCHFPGCYEAFAGDDLRGRFVTAECLAGIPDDAGGTT